MNFVNPIEIEGVKRFLGLVNYHRKFIPRYADFIEPISKLLRNNVECNWKIEQKTF